MARRNRIRVIWINVEEQMLTDQDQQELDNISRLETLLRQELTRLGTLKDAVLGRTMVQCTSSVLGEGCGEWTEIRDLTYLQTLWWSTSQGDWLHGEGQFDCPLCKRRNRLYDRPEIAALKRHFKAVENVDDD